MKRHMRVWGLAAGPLVLLASFASPSAAATPAATSTPAASRSAYAAEIARGQYLVRAGDCQSCHTKEGGTPFAGGRMLPTPFGPISTPNITPDPETGIGRWNDADFYRAMHEGIDKEGKNLYPVFPYPWFTKVRRADVLAIKAYLFSLPPAHAPRPPSRLTFPFNIRAGLDVWRALFFKAGVFTPDKAHSAEVNRGAYLVEGLGHCGACHTPRNLAEAPKAGRMLAGGVIPAQDWYAPNISGDPRDGIGDWTIDEIVAFLGTGTAEGKGVAIGPMAETVRDSLSKLKPADLHAIAAYLKSTSPQTEAQATRTAAPEIDGARVYLSHCAFCHRPDGRGVPGAVPTLAGNGAVTTPSPDNVLKAVIGGLPATDGYAPMPALGESMSPAEIAAVANYVRTAWSNKAPANAEPGMAGKLASELPIALSGSGPACPPLGPEVVNPGTDLVPVITDPANGILPLLKGITPANMLDQVGAVVTKLEALHPKGPKARLVNALTTAYCPVVAAAPDLDLSQRREELHRFGQLVYGQLSAGPASKG